MIPERDQRVRVGYKRHPEGPTFYTTGRTEETPSAETFALIRGQTQRGERQLIVEDPELRNATISYKGTFIGMVQSVAQWRGQ